MRPDDFAQARGRDGGAQEIVGGLSRGLQIDLARAGDFSNGLEARLLVIVLQPGDVVRNRSRAGFDAAVIGFDDGLHRDRLRGGIVEISADIVIKIALIALEGQGVIAALVDDLACDGALTVERIDRHDAALQRKHRQELGNGGDLVRLGVGGDLAQHQALPAAPGADHVQGRCGARSIERAAQHLAVDGYDALAGLAKARREGLKPLPKRFRFESPEYPGERVMRRLKWAPEIGPAVKL